MRFGGMSEAELRALLQLHCRPGLGGRGLTSLLGRYGDAETVLALPPDQLGEAPERPIAARTARALRLIEAQELDVLAVHRPGYPKDLLELPDPPPVLFARGDPSLIGVLSVAVVGTRRPTDYGLEATELLVAGLAREGVVVWSGLARGIDGAAHRTAIAQGGRTVAVLGSGIDVPYPREHAELLEEVAGNGLVLSEFMPGEPPLPHHFPQRNRIIARLAHGVLVVEARPDGGALITADAGASTRPVMAVPGPIGRITSMGPNRLIQEGAKLVVDVADIIEEIGGPFNVAAARPRPSARRQWQRVVSGAGRPQLPLRAVAPLAVGARSPEPSEAGGVTGMRAVLEASPEPLHADEIAAACGITAGAALARLLQLEVAGMVEQVGGKRFRLAERPRANRFH